MTSKVNSLTKKRKNESNNTGKKEDKFFLQNIR